MKKTMIVDDDYLVRSYLKMLPSWEKAGYEIAADVRDGEEACRMLEETKLDLVVTDISMPLVDGIELIKRIRKKDQRIYIIVLSCHDDFEYVKEAMREGADEYILKNTLLDEESLYQLLVNTEKKIAEREKQSREQEHMESLAKTGNHNLKYIFFNKILAGTLKGAEREQERLRAGIQGTYQNSAVVSVFLDSWEEGEERWSCLEMEQYCQNFLIRLCDEMRDTLDFMGKSMEAVYLGMGVFCCFLDLSDLRKSSAMHQRLTSVAASCYKLCKKEPYSYKIGVSNVCMGAEAIRQAYQQAREMMKFSFYDEQEILYYEIEKKLGAGFPQEAQTLLQQADHFRYSHDQEGFLKACQAAGEAFEREATDSRLVLQWLKKLEQELGIPGTEECKRIHRIGQVCERLKEDAQTVFGSGRPKIAEDISKPVRIAAEYVMDHYKEPIGLPEAAQAAGVNPAYLSYLFRQEMDIGFSNFLLDRRIACAMEMLKKTNLKVWEVAERSGFHEYHYFSRAFKKRNGISPAEYRKRQ